MSICVCVCVCVFVHFLADVALQNMVETKVPEGLETSAQTAYHLFWNISRCFWVFAFQMIFPFFQIFGFWGILGQPYCGIGATIWIGREMLCLPYAGLLCTFWVLSLVLKKKYHFWWLPSVTRFVNHKGVCRTAPATLGLLMILKMG